MIQLPFPSTIEAQPRNVTFLTIKAVVRKIQKNDGQTGSGAWARQCLDKGEGVLFKGGYDSRGLLFKGGYNYSRAVIIQGRLQLFKGGYFSRAFTFQGRLRRKGAYYSRAVTIQGRFLFRGRGGYTWKYQPARLDATPPKPHPHRAHYTLPHMVPTALPWATPAQVMTTYLRMTPKAGPSCFCTGSASGRRGLEATVHWNPRTSETGRLVALGHEQRP